MILSCIIKCAGCVPCQPGIRRQPAGEAGVAETDKQVERRGLQRQTSRLRGRGCLNKMKVGVAETDN